MHFRKRSSDSTIKYKPVSALRRLTGFCFSDLLEHTFQKLAQRFVRDAESPFSSVQFNISYSLCYRQDCLEALNRNQELNLEEARKSSVLTGLVQGQAYVWGFLLMAGA